MATSMSILLAGSGVTPNFTKSAPAQVKFGGCSSGGIFSMKPGSWAHWKTAPKSLFSRGNFMERKKQTTPAALGFSMPAEWEPHEATWLGWPHHPTDWPDKLDTIRWVYGEIVRKIAPGEIVRILVDNKAEERSALKYLRSAGARVSRIEFITHPTNRGWTRDSGPIFVRRKLGEGKSKRPETAITHFHFNAWAKYKDWQKDRRVPETAARLLRKRVFHAEYHG